MSRYLVALGVLLAVTEVPRAEAQSVHVQVGRRPYFDYGGHRPYGISVGSSRFGLNIDIGRRYSYGYGQVYDPYDAYYNYRYDYRPDDAYYGYRPSTRVYGPPPTPLGQHAPLPTPESLEGAPLGDGAPVPIEARRESTDEERRQSAHSQEQGDLWLQQLNYRNAAAWYRQAIEQAPDIGAPYIRLAVAESALGQYERAADHLRTGVRLDPTWPVTGPSPSELFGPGNAAAQLTVSRNIYAWSLTDPRDPDRLFLTAAFAYFNGYRDKAMEMFALGLRLERSGDDTHLMAFLRPARPVEEPTQTAPAPAPAPTPTDREDFIPEPPPSGEPSGERIPQRREEQGTPDRVPSLPRPDALDGEPSPTSVPVSKEDSAAGPNSETPPAASSSGPVIPQPQPN